MIARNKRAVTLNLSHLADRELLERLAADTDVLVENFRPGVLEKWGPGPHRMHQVNPALVILRVAGSGQIGPGAARGLLAAPKIAAVSGVRHLSMGGADLRKDLGTDDGNLQMPYPRTHIVAAPRRRSTASTRASARSPPPTATRSGWRTVNSSTFPSPTALGARRPAPGLRGRTKTARIRLTQPSHDMEVTTMAEMKGQVALVTGGIRGIGLAICERLAGRGVTVAAGYSANAEAARQFRDKYADYGATVHQGDVGSGEDCARVVSEVLDQHGQLDILVNNAGITVDKTVRKMTPADWDHVIGVNLSGAFYLSRAVLQHMLDRGYGRIVNISSVIGSAGGFGQANYAAAKSGMFGLTMSMALETARKNITVNTVTPGFISTDMTAAVPAAAMENILAKIPAGRLGDPDEVARVVEFLADPESAYITGQVYPVNGGLYM